MVGVLKGICNRGMPTEINIHDGTNLVYKENIYSLLVGYKLQ